MMFLAFLLCYLWCWKYQVEDYEDENTVKDYRKKIKEIRKNFDIDVP